MQKAKQEIMSHVESYADARVNKGYSTFTAHVDKRKAALEACIERKLEEAANTAYTFAGFKKFLKGKLWP